MELLWISGAESEALEGARRSLVFEELEGFCQADVASDVLCGVF